MSTYLVLSQFERDRGETITDYRILSQNKCKGQFTQLPFQSRSLFFTFSNWCSFYFCLETHCFLRLLIVLLFTILRNSLFLCWYLFCFLTAYLWIIWNWTSLNAVRIHKTTFFNFGVWLLDKIFWRFGCFVTKHQNPCINSVPWPNLYEYSVVFTLTFYTCMSYDSQMGYVTVQ